MSVTGFIWTHDKSEMRQSIRGCINTSREYVHMGIFTRRHKDPQLQSTAAFEQLISEGKPVLFDFYKYGCQPCQIMDGIVNEVAGEFQEDAIVVKANLETVSGSSGKFKVESTPTFVLLVPSGKGLNQRWRHSELVKKDIMVGKLVSAVGRT